VKAAVVSTHEGGMWSWLFQRITAVLLIVCLAIHLILTHLANIGNLSYDTVGKRVAHGSVTAVDIILLAAGLYHALNGLRMVLMDYWFTSRKWALVLTVVLWVVGLAFLSYGIWALWPWIGYQAGVK
jgi:succinate dehydrogenase cytochrome b556 subunit